MTLSISEHGDGAAVTLLVSGDVDLTTVEQLERRITQAAASDARTVVVDLAGVAFMDSAGINALLKGRRLADEHSQSFWITNATDIVRELLVMTGVWDYLTGPVQ